MRKNILSVIIATVIISLIGYSTFIPKDNKVLSHLALENIEALASYTEQTQDTVRWFVHTGNCSYTTTVDAEGNVNIFGTIKAVKLEAGASYTETWTNVRTDCSQGGSFLCTPYTCGEFFLEMENN